MNSWCLFNNDNHVQLLLHKSKANQRTSQSFCWHTVCYLNLSCLLFLNWGDLQGHSTSLKICSKAKYFRIKCTIHNVAWHAYGTCKYAGSHMHPKHDQQEISLNMKGGGDSQNLRGQEIFRSSNCTNEKKMLSSSNIGRGGLLVSSHPLFLNI